MFYGGSHRKWSYRFVSETNFYTPPPKKKKNPLTWFLRKGMKLTIKDKDNFDTI